MELKIENLDKKNDNKKECIYLKDKDIEDVFETF